jgi:carotenoid cleavage dioxygenase-like enzyme
MDVLYGLQSERFKPDGKALVEPVGRFEGEIHNLVVFGEIPKEINGTFYRIMVDPAYPLYPGNPAVEGDGNLSAFRIHDGRAELKIKYIETERYLLERKANQRLFGLYRNPFTHNPCVRAAVDSTANTNMVYWAGQLMALKESALPYAVDPDTLETLEYDPFGSQINAKTFTAHLKVDPYTNELVVFGYEAKGLATKDVVIYALDKEGRKKDEQWIEAPWCSFIHDCAITENWIILLLWPFEATTIDEMKEGSQHWEWKPDRGAAFIVVPRRKDTPRPKGWGNEGFRYYEWDHAITLHSASAWKETDGILYCESVRVMYNMLPWFEKNPAQPQGEPKADVVRWKIDLNQPSNTRIADPKVILDAPAEFPRIDERFNSRKYDHIFLPVIRPGTKGGITPLDLNSLAHLNTRTEEVEYFDPGEDRHVAEPIFVPRSEKAEEGDGWVMVMVTRRPTRSSELVILDTRSFSKPTAVIKLPFMLAMQVHGNWVDQAEVTHATKSFERVPKDVHVSGRGSLSTE